MATFVLLFVTVPADAIPCNKKSMAPKITTPLVSNPKLVVQSSSVANYKTASCHLV